ncbi:MAG: type I polyketide synthase, partial [Gemmatimonadetes bacterium]|nr:type I polyketide synthase [Gemmatimonadota bacterium]
LDPALVRHPRFVGAQGVLEGADRFDAAFFGFTPREAEVTDPQQRLFMECAWEALEHAGHDPQRLGGRVGVYAGVNSSTYLSQNLLPNAAVLRSASHSQVSFGNEKDFIATRTSYKLGLEGPAAAVQTACSTSLVAVHFACQSLLGGDCDVALAGGASVVAAQITGYVHEEGGIRSADGRGRAFDHRASGTVRGNGVGVVVLRRLEDAVADGDTVYAVIRGSAMNNDGSAKVGFTAPGLQGQARVIQAAQATAEVAPGTVTCIEAHGTATALGDPIEVAALTQAFRVDTDRTGFCALGSVKSSIGHLDSAAGVAGLIKMVLALHHGQIPPSLHFQAPNPALELESSPFFVPTRLMPWERNGTPRRAGVSSFGIGGTNAHVVLEEAPAPAESGDPARPLQLLVLSAKTEEALRQAAERLADHLEANPAQPLADVAHTLRIGRRAFALRRAVAAGTHEQAAAALREPATAPVPAVDGARVAFLFPGQGAQHPGMARGLYDAEPVFRAALDRCADGLLPHLGVDLRTLLFDVSDEAEERLRRTEIAQPALFAVCFALCEQWKAWGVEPAAMLGHSIGEYVAAARADVFRLDDALALVAARGRLMGAMQPGAMTAVPMAEAELLPLLGPGLSLAAVNASSACVVAGPFDAVEALEAALAERGVQARRLRTSHAFHSAMMEPALAEFAAAVAQACPRAPSIPFVSNLTGTWITDA